MIYCPRFTGSVLNLDLAYDPVSNITALTDLLNASQSQAFDYDELDRLVSAIGAYGYRDYDYDPVGNRLTRESDTVAAHYAYAADSNRLIEISGGPSSRQYSYDANGNIRRDGRFAYTYNQANRLSRVTALDAERARYTHNALGQRTRKALPGGGSNAAQRTEAEAQLAYHLAEAERLQNLAAQHLSAGGNAETEARTLDGQAVALRPLAQQKQDNAAEFVALAETHETHAATVDNLIAQLEGTRIDNPFTWLQRLFNRTMYLVMAELRGLADERRAQAAQARSQAATPLTEAEQALAQAESMEQQAAAHLAEAQTLREQATAAQQQSSFHTEQAALWAHRVAELRNDPTSPTGHDTHFVYDLEGRLIGEYDPGGSPIREYVYPEGTPFAMLHEGKIYYYHTDHLGTPRRMTASDQRIVWDAIQSPFGTMMLLTEEIENPLRFPGQYEPPRVLRRLVGLSQAAIAV